MRDHRDVISVAAATASGFAMPYRTSRPVQPNEIEAADALLIARLRRNPCCAVALATTLKGAKQAQS
ncbi:hypothetical protein [Methyloceanibacter sp.]|uniref:hypothetical protein n=1 Tax=Methyloceanibacter sp. TaxID=1965321 RepID=UPI002D3AE857|nr:hypothetical protein [Methyloceanibacter sp.]HZP10393.1 hypothetical protein [Methyloceanibacter sp.]